MQTSGMSFDQLELEYQNRKKAIDEVEAERTQLQQRLTELDERLKILRGENRVIGWSKPNIQKVTGFVSKSIHQSSAPIAKEVKAKTPAKNNRSVRDIAYGVLRQLRKPTHISRIVDEMFKQGYQTVSSRKVFTSSVASSLAKDKQRFTSLGNGNYMLATGVGE